MSTPTLAYDFTPESMAAAAEIELREKGMNFLRKQELLRDEKFRLRDEAQLRWSCGFGRSEMRDQWTPEVAAYYRAKVEASIAWLEANPGDDLPPARVERLMGLVRRAQAEAERLCHAVEWVQEVEDNCLELEAKSRTRECLEKKFYEAKREVTSCLGDLVRKEEMDFVCAMSQRWFSRRSLRRWRVYRDEHYPRLLLTDFAIAPARCVEFENIVGAAKSLKDVKRLLAVWHMDCRVVEEDGAKIVQSEGGLRIVPCKY